MKRTFFRYALSLFIISTLQCIQLKEAVSQELEKQSMTAFSVVDKEITIDGLLNESIWQIGQAATGFVQQEPNVGAFAQTETFVRIAYDNENIYIGVLLNDPNPEAVRGDERQEDGSFNRSDTFGVLIDTYHDHQNAFFFETNLLSAMSDALISQEGLLQNRDWDGNWEVAAKRTATGWSAEFRIPFETIRFKPGEAQTWGVQFRRRVPHLKEVSFWNPLTAEQTFFEISRSGHVDGIKTTAQVKPFSFKPYLKASYQKDKTGTKDISEDDFDGGLDFRYRFKTNLTLDVTYNTDFAETEIDRFQTNLTRFPLFFPEKREFFLEGKGYYDFGLSGRVQPFFSRQIGLVNFDEVVPIFFGGKLSGKVGPYGIGALVMETESKGDAPTERFGLARMSRDIGLRSNLGFIVTERAEKDHSGNGTLGFDGTFAPNAYLTTSGFWVASRGKASIDEGEASFAQVQWRDPFWRIRLDHLRIDPRFMGDPTSSSPSSPILGFVQQRDLHETYTFVDIRPQQETGITREIGLKTELTYQTDANGNFLYQSNYNRFQADFRSGDFLLISVDPQRERLPDQFTIRPGITIPAGTYTYTHTNIIFFTDSRRPVSGVASFLWGGFYGGDKTSFDLSLTLAPEEGVKIGAGWELNQVDLPQGDFTAQLLNGDVAWSLNNEFLLQALMQWDEEEKSLEANFRLSWEYQESSWVYLVINPSRQKDQDALLVLAKVNWLWEP